MNDLSYSDRQGSEEVDPYPKVLPKLARNLTVKADHHNRTFTSKGTALRMDEPSEPLSYEYDFQDPITDKPDTSS